MTFAMVLSLLPAMTLPAMAATTTYDITVSDSPYTMNVWNFFTDTSLLTSSGAGFSANSDPTKFSLKYADGTAIVYTPTLGENLFSSPEESGIIFESTTPGDHLFTVTCYDYSTGSVKGSVTVTVTVSGDNTAPTVTAIASNPTFTEGESAVSLFSDATASLGGSDTSQTLTELKLTVTNLANGSSETLNVDGTSIPLTTGTPSTTATNNLSYSVSVTGSTATVTLSKAAGISVTAMQTLIKGISYANSSDALANGDRIVTLTSLKDSGGGTDTTALTIPSTVAVVGVNDAPTLTALGANPTFTEDGSAADVFSTVTASTIEADQKLTELKLTVGSLADGSNEILNADGSDIVLKNGATGTTATNSMTYSVSVSDSTATVTLSTAAGISAAAMQTLVDGISYKNNSNTPTTTSGRVVTLTSINDNGGTENSGADKTTLSIPSTVTVAAANDAPFTRDTTSFLQLGAGAVVKTSSGTVATTQTDNITLEACIYLDDATGTHALLFNGNGGGSGYGIYLNYPGASPLSVLLGGVGWIYCSSGDSYDAANNAVLTAGRWMHIAVTRNTSDGGTQGWKVYINGHPMATCFVPTPGPTATPKSMDGSSNVQIGGATDPEGLSISEARIWNRALTQAEIQANMSGTVAEAAAGLAGYWKLNDGSGTTVKDFKGTLNLPITGTYTWVASTAGSTAEDTAISGRLLGGDVETSVTYAKATNPAHGTVTVNSNGSYTYTPADDYNGTDSFKFTTSDGSLSSADRAVNITIASVNDAPTVTTSGGTTAFTEGANVTSVPVAIDSGITFTDPDNDTLTSATVSISGNFLTGQDLLAFSNTSVVTYGNIAASYNTATGILTLTSESATATKDQWLSALCAVTYTNSSDNPNTSTRTISFAANDGTATGAAATKSVSVTASNDAPTLTSGAGTTTYTENASGTIVDSGITISDSDSNTLSSATVSIAAGFLTGKDVLGFENGDAATYGNIAVDSFNTTTGVLTLISEGATATTAQWQAALRAVKFSSTADAPGTTRTVSFKVKDVGNAESAAVTKDITVTPVNDAPTDIALDNASIAEGTATDTKIGTLSTTDPDSGDTFSYSIQSVKDKNNNSISTDTFAISGNELRTKAALSYSTNNSFKVTIRTSDGKLTCDKDFTITVTETNVAPTNISLSASSINENSAIGTPIGTLSTTDANTPAPFSYSIVAGDTACFKISGSELQLDTVPDFETKDSYSITIRTKDNGNLTYDKTFTINIANVNEAPVLTPSGGTSAFTEAATGTSTPVVVDVGLTVADVDSSTVLSAVTATISTNYNSTQDVLSFTNDGSTMGNITASYSTGTGVLTLSSEGGTATVTQWQAALRAVKYTNTSHNPTVFARTVTFSVSDGELSATATKNVSVTQTNSAPTDIALTNSTVEENKAVGEPVGIFSATDADADDAYSYSLVTGLGAGDNASFTIENVAETGYVLKLAACPDFEAKSSFSIRVRATDLAAATYDEVFTVIVTNVNEAPSITSGATASVEENVTGTVYDANATDPDVGDTITFSISGTDAALFDINSSTGTLTFKTAPNFESPTDNGSNNVYDLTITATDNGTGSLAKTKALDIIVTNVNEAPVISASAALSVTEGSTTAFTAAATDPEADSVTWSISGGTDAGKFSIVPGTGVVTFTTAPSYSTPSDSDAKNDYVLDITASDGTLSATNTITITVTQKAIEGGASSTSAVVEVNGQKQDAGTSSTVTSGGQTVTTIMVDDTKLEKILDSSGEKPTVTLPSSGSDATVGELNGQTVKNMETKDATLEIKTDSVSYTLPASQINIDAVSGQLGEQVALKDIKVSVRIAEPPADTVKIVEDTANKGNYQLVVKPIEFEITCTSGDKTVEVSKFNGYVERTVAIPDGVDPSKITTGIVLNSDGSFSHVPTTIVVISGKYYAKINSLTNSTYSVIYNPVTFTDVTSHWAKNAINDMGSRMVVTGMGDGSYEPDRSITRAEFAAIVVRALGLQKGATESAFSDVTLTDWFNGYVDTATAYSLITGYDSVSYGPSDTITREQAMTILARAMKLTGLSVSLTDSETSAILANYTDSAGVSSYAKAAAALCIKTGVVTGSSATTLSPKAYVTRAEVAVMVQRLLQKSGLI